MAKDNVFYSSISFGKGKESLSLDQPLIMGILNCTPDSFFASSRVQNEREIISRAEQFIDEGAEIIDLGGFSTRPGAVFISEEEEANRVLPSVKLLRSTFPDLNISLDTFRAEIAKKALDLGVSMINDISGGNFDKKMYYTVIQYDTIYILSHLRGSLQDLHAPQSYRNVVEESLEELKEKLAQLRTLGQQAVIIDPGIGFSKSIENNFQIISSLNRYQELNCPLLIGVSRKSFIYKTLSCTAEESLSATSALHLHALQQGAKILRVHDVKEAKKMVRLFERLKSA